MSMEKVMVEVPVHDNNGVKMMAMFDLAELTYVEDYYAKGMSILCFRNGKTMLADVGYLEMKDILKRSSKTDEREKADVSEEPDGIYMYAVLEKGGEAGETGKRIRPCVSEVPKDTEGSDNGGSVLHGGCDGHDCRGRCDGRQVE